MTGGEQLDEGQRLRWWQPAAARAGSVALALVVGLVLTLSIGFAAWRTLAAPDGASAASTQFVWALQLLTLMLSLLLALVALAWAAWRQQGQGQALREARARLASLDEVLDVWQWQSDAEHRLTRIRPPRGAAVGEWPAQGEGALLWSQFQGVDAAALRTRMARGAALDDIECERKAAGSGHIPGRLSARACADASGAFAGYVGTFRDADSGSAASPTSAVDVPIDIAAAPAEISASDSEHESFSYTVSHDLRAPIRVVEGFTKIVKEDYGRLLDRVGNDHLDRVLGAAARMNSMIDALLALSKLSSQPLARQPVNLSQLAGYVTDDLRRQWPERKVQVEIEPGLLVLGDPTLLRMLLENLLGNAWKYTAKTAEPCIWVERRPTDADCFTVRDNGAGFDMRFAERLFGVFQRLHSANDFPGTGVGLASVQRIVRRHGGNIWGEAEVNQGARFHFSLPQRSASRLPPSASDESVERRQP